MRRLLLATAALSVAISNAAAADMPAEPVAAESFPAATVWDAYFSADIGTRWRSVDFGPGSVDDSGLTFGGRGTGAYNFGNGFGVQTDLTYRRDLLGSVEDDDFEGDLTASDIDGALHLFLRDPNRGLIGFVGQLGQTTFDIASVGINLDRYYAGLEGQMFMGNFTLYAQAAYENIDIGNGASDGFFGGLDELGGADGWIGKAELRYFVNKNWRLLGNASYAVRTFDDTGGGSLELTTFGIGAGTEYKFENVPFSVYANADWHTTDFSTSGGGPDEISLDSTRVLVGLKLNLGEASLLDRDRSGASLDPVPYTRPLVDFFSAILEDGVL